MKLPKYVKPFPFNPLGVKGNMFAPTKTIFLRKDIYTDLRKSKPSHLSISVLMHEEAHRKNMGLGIKYLFFPKSRVEEELSAYKVQFSYLKKNKTEYDLERIARAFSGPIYLWAKSYKDAKEMIEKTWREA